MRTITLLLLLLALSGCSTKPGDTPPLYSCTITVLNNGTPLPNAEVYLAKVDETKAMWFFGKAGSNGVATIQTHYGSYTAAGVPEGEFKIAVNQKIVLETNDPNIDTSRSSDPKVVEYLKKREEELASKRAVPPLLTDLETTPLSIKIEPNKSNTLTVDIAEHGKSTPSQ